MKECTSIPTDSLIDILSRIVYHAVLIEREPVDIGDGVMMSASEMHLIDHVGRYPGNHITQIAQQLGVTKGAVSQMAQKLEKKGHLTKKQEQENQKNVYLSLTESGMVAFTWHRAYHKTVDYKLSQLLASFQQREVENLMRMLEALDEMLINSIQNPNQRK